MARKDTTIQGFLIHSERVSTDNLADVGAGALQSTYTEATPRPGQSIADDACSRIQPRVHGAQTEDLLFGCIRGGIPAPEGAGIVWRKDSETASDFRSWNPPTVLEHFQWVEYHDSGTRNWDDLDLVVVPDTQTAVLVANDSAGAANNSCWIYTPSTRSWGSRATIATPWNKSAIAAAYVPDLCGILVIAAPQSEAGSAYLSTDEGTTWTKHGEDFLDTVPSIAGEAHLVVDRYGHLLLLIENSTYETWRSTDGGATFTQVESVAAGWTDADVCRMANGSILVVYSDSGDSDIKAVVLPSSFDTIANATEIVVETGTYDEVACCTDADGVVWIFGRASGGTINVFRSLDHMDNDLSVGSCYEPNTNNNTLDHFVIQACCGEVLLAGNPDVTTSTSVEPSIVSVQFGGWSNVEYGAENDAAELPTNRRGWAVATRAETWVSTELPANNGWTTAGSGTIALSVSGWNHTTSSTGKYHTITWTYDNAALAWVFELEVVSGGSLATTDIGFRITRVDGTNKTILYVNADSTGFRLIDNVVSTLGTITQDMTSPVQVLVYYDAIDSITVWYRSPSSATWSGGTSFSLTTTSTASTTETVVFGHPATATAESNWMWCAYAERPTVRHKIADSTKYDGFVYGKGLSLLSYPVRDEGDSSYRTRLSLAGAPGRKGDTFTVAARYDHGIDKVFPQIAPSPKRAWRSTQTAVAEDWVIDLTEDTRFDPGSFLGLCVLGKHTPRTIEVATSTDAAGSFTTRGTYDGATGFTSLTYTLSGDVIYANGGTVGGRYLRDNELAGGYVILDTGGTPKCRTILANGPGWWNGTSTIETWIRLDGIDGTENAGATCHIVAPGGVMLIPQAVTVEFRYLRVRVPVQDLPDSYVTLGVHVLGGILVPGHRWSRGWSWREVPNVAIREDSYGTTYARKRGPVRRELTWSYQDLSDETEMLTSSSTTWIGAADATAPLAGKSDVLGRLGGLLTTSKGGELPIVAILDIPNSASTTTITDRHLWLYGVLRGSVQANHVVGRSGVDPVYRIERLSITELPWDLD